MRRWRRSSAFVTLDFLLLLSLNSYDLFEQVGGTVVNVFECRRRSRDGGSDGRRWRHF